MLVNVQVAIAVNGEVYHAVFANLFQHVVEETQSCLNVATTVAVEVDLYPYIRLFGSATNLSGTFSAKSDGSSLLPTLCSQPTRGTVYL